MLQLSVKLKSFKHLEFNKQQIKNEAIVYLTESVLENIGG